MRLARLILVALAVAAGAGCEKVAGRAPAVRLIP